jgi:hypothetical protein
MSNLSNESKDVDMVDVAAADAVTISESMEVS